MGSIQMKPYQGKGGEAGKAEKQKQETERRRKLTERDEKGFTFADRLWLKLHGGHVVGKGEEAPTSETAWKGQTGYSDQQEAERIALKKKKLLGDIPDIHTPVPEKDITVREDVSDTFTDTTKVPTLSKADTSSIKYEYKFETIPGHFTRAWGATEEDARQEAIKTFREIDSKRPLSKNTFKSLGKTGMLQVFIPGVSASGIFKMTEKEYADWKKERGTIGEYNIDTDKGIKKFYAVDEEQAKREAETQGLEVKKVEKVGDKILTPKLEKDIREKGEQGSPAEWTKQKYEAQIKLGELSKDTVYTPEGPVAQPSNKIVELKNGDIVNKVDYDKLTATEQHNLMNLGVEGFNKLSEVKNIVAMQGINQQKLALKKLEKYKGKAEEVVSGRVQPKQDVYDIDKALRDGVSSKVLSNAGFSTDAIQAAQERNIVLWNADISDMDTAITNIDKAKNFDLNKNSQTYKEFRNRYPEYFAEMEKLGLGYNVRGFLETDKNTMAEVDLIALSKKMKTMGISVPDIYEINKFEFELQKDYDKWREDLPSYHPVRLLQEGGAELQIKTILDKAQEKIATWAKTDEEKEIANKELYDKIMSGLTKAQTKVGKFVEGKRQSAIGLDNNAAKAVAGFGAGLLEMAAGIGVSIPVTLLKANLELSAGQYKTAAKEASALPIGIGSWALVEAPTRIKTDPLGGVSVLVGNLAFPYVAKGVAGALSKGTMKAIATAKVLKNKGILPKGFKTGGNQLWTVEVPEGFRKLTNELDIIAKDKAQVKAIFESGLSKKTQMAKVRSLLNPETRPIYDAYMKLIEEGATFKVPKSMIRDLNLADVSSIPKTSALELKAYLQKNSGIIKVHGSLADWVQTKGMKGITSPGDIDINITGKIKPEVMASQIAEIIRKTSKNKVRVKGGTVEVLQNNVWTKAFDIHTEGTFGGLPYEWSELKPTKIDGISFQTLGEQFYRRGEQIINPGVGRAAGKMGPEAAARPWRLKDINRMLSEAEGMVEYFKKTGNLAKAEAMTSLIKEVKTAPSLAKLGKTQPMSEAETGALMSEFVEMVADVQKATMNKGVDVSLYNQQGILTRIVSPAGKITPDVIYTVTRDVTPYLDALKAGKQVKVGYIYEKGKWVKADRPQIFASQDVAYNYLYDLYNGKVPKEAGVIAVRTVRGDIGKSINPAFRNEYYTKLGESKPIVLDEWTIAENTKLYATNPTPFSLSKNSVSKGLTGEVLTYNPLTNKTISVVYLATEAAKKAGLGAPSITQVKSINLLALRNTIADLIRPHLAKNVLITTDSKIKGGGDLVEFYKNTYKWEKGTPSKTSNIVNKADTFLNKEASKALANRVAKGETFTPTQWQKAFEVELSKVASQQAANMIGANPKIANIIKTTSPTTLSNTYVIHLQSLMNSLALTGLGAAGITKASDLTTDNLSVPSKLITATPSEIIKATQPSISTIKESYSKDIHKRVKPTEDIISKDTPDTVEIIEASSKPVTKERISETIKSEPTTVETTKDVIITEKPLATTRETIEETTKVEPSIITTPIDKSTIYPPTTKADTTIRVPSKTTKDEKTSKETKTTPKVTTTPSKTPTETPTITTEITPTATPETTPTKDITIIPIPETTPKTFPIPVTPIAHKTPPTPPVWATEKFSSLTKRQREGIIAWKQGWVYKMIYPPYHQQDIINTKYPIPGVEYHKGAKSAARSIISIGGRVPALVTRDMGIFDLRIRTPKGARKPRIKYKRDIKQKTRTTPGIKVV